MDRVETQMLWIMQLQSACCGDEDDNESDEGDALRWKPRVKQTEEKREHLTEWVAAEQNEKQNKTKK